MQIPSFDVPSDWIEMQRSKKVKPYSSLLLICSPSGAGKEIQNGILKVKWPVILQARWRKLFQVPSPFFCPKEKKKKIELGKKSRWRKRAKGKNISERSYVARRRKLLLRTKSSSLLPGEQCSNKIQLPRHEKKIIIKKKQDVERDQQRSLKLDSDLSIFQFSSRQNKHTQISRIYALIFWRSMCRRGKHKYTLI